MLGQAADATRLEDAGDEIAARRSLMAACASATLAELRAALGAVEAEVGPLDAVEDIRAPEIGTVMLRGRMGGDGRAFQLGEATVTRAAVRLADGRAGFAWQMGRDPSKARLAAILDGLLQGVEREAVERAMAAPRARMAEERASRSRRAAATKVDFFTMVRGDD